MTDEEEFKPDYGRRALFMAEENTQRIFSLEKQLVTIKKALTEKPEPPRNHTVTGLARISARAEIIHGDLVRTVYNNAFQSIVPYIEEGLRYTEYIMLSESREKLPAAGAAAQRLFVAPVTFYDGNFTSGGGVLFVSKSVEIPAYSVLDGKTVNSLGFCSGSGNKMFTQGILPEGIVKEAGKTLTLTATVYLDFSFSGAMAVYGSEALARLSLGCRSGGRVSFMLTAGEESFVMEKTALSFSADGFAANEISLSTDGEQVLFVESEKALGQVLFEITPAPAYG